MKVTLCGSISFYKEMTDIKNKLEALGHQVKLPPIKVPDKDGNFIPVEKYYEIRKIAGDNEAWVWERKAQAIQSHFDKVAWADAILVTNFDKKGINGYIGANTLMEMGVAFHLKKPIFLLNQIPKLDYKEEILGMQPIVVNNDLNKIKYA
jgi:nucleoside 2-deoxyribosyltransferase